MPLTEASSSTATRKLAHGIQTTVNLTSCSRNTLAILITLSVLLPLNGCALSNVPAISQILRFRRLTKLYQLKKLLIMADALPGIFKHLKLMTNPLVPEDQHLNVREKILFSLQL
jgi:hypothetical protein